VTRFTFLIAAALVAAPLGAELAILSGGEVLKVSEWEVSEETVRLTLPSGGRLTLPLLRVERIVEDEIVSKPEPLVSAPLALRFSEKQTEPDIPFGGIIYGLARSHRVNPQLVAAVVQVESAFDPEAVSNKGARGLMQLMPATARRFGVEPEELFEPEKNVEAGVRYLSWLIDRFSEDLSRVLAAYNAGEATVDRYKGVPPYRETREYIRRVHSVLGFAAD
jgi:hypothetical protein